MYLSILLRFTADGLHTYLDTATATLYQPGEESLIPGVLEKTKGAIEYFCKTMEFDYLYRTNLSSVFDMDKMLEYLENNPVDYAGKLENAFDEYEFVSGSGYVLSRRACGVFLDHYEEIACQHDLFDDVATGKIMQKYVKMSYIPRVTFSYMCTFAIKNTIVKHSAICRCFVVLDVFRNVCRLERTDKVEHIK